MRLKDGPLIKEIIDEEQANLFLEKRNSLRVHARETIAKVQAEPGLKFGAKFLGPYKITRLEK